MTGLFAATFFSGETGVAASLINREPRGIEPALTLNGYIAGQLTFSDLFSMRGEFSLLTDDMYRNGLTKDAESVFRITELSGTFTKSFAGATHTLSLFLGSFEAIGSQQFVTRHLGVQSYSSMLTENYLGQNGATVYSVYGAGGNYALTFKNVPVSMGLAVTKADNFEDVAQMNVDFRLAAAFRYLTVDLAAGVGAPLYTKNANDEDVFVLIDTLYLHLGADILLGSRHDLFSLYVQNGFDYLPIKKTSKSREFDFSDMHLLVEPRLNFGAMKIHITAFSLPLTTAEKMLYLDDTLGVNLNFFADALHTEKRDYAAGLSMMVSFENKHLNDIEAADIKDAMNIKLAPFTEIDVAGGRLRIMLQAGMLKFINSKEDALKLNICYKKEL